MEYHFQQFPGRCGVCRQLSDQNSFLWHGGPFPVYSLSGDDTGESQNQLSVSTGFKIVTLGDSVDFLSSPWVSRVHGVNILPTVHASCHCLGRDCSLCYQDSTLFYPLVPLEDSEGPQTPSTVFLSHTHLIPMLVPMGEAER